MANGKGARSAARARRPAARPRRALSRRSASRGGRRGRAAAGRGRRRLAGACRADRRGPAGLGDAGPSWRPASWRRASWRTWPPAGAGAFFGVALGLATVCGGVARERRSIGRASEDEGTASTPSSGRSHGDAVASMALQGTRQNAPSSSPARAWPRASWPRASWRTSWPARAPPRARRS